MHKFFIYLMFFLVFIFFSYSAYRTKIEGEMLDFVTPEGMSSGIWKFIRSSSIFNPFFVDAWGENEEKLVQFADSLGKNLIQEKIVEPEEISLNEDSKENISDFLFKHRFYLTGLKTENVESILTQEEITKRLALSRMLLLSPAGAFFQERISRDPLNLFGFVEENLKKGTGATILAAKKNNCLFSQDGKHCLFTFHPKIHAYNFSEAESFMGKLETILKKLQTLRDFSNIDTILIGPHLFTAYESKIIKNDIKVAFIITTTLAIILVFLIFRRFTPFLLMAIITTFSLVCAIAFTGFSNNSIHGVTLGFASTLLGICVDYAIHTESVWNAFSKEEMTIETRVQRLTGLLPSLFGAWITTIIIFAIMSFSSFKLVKQIGLLGVTGVTSAFLCSLVIIPVFPHKSINKNSSLSMHLQLVIDKIIRSKTLSISILILGTIIFITSIWKGRGLELEHDVEKFQYRSPALEENLKIFQKRWGVLGKGDIIISKGKSIEESLQKNDFIYEKLQKELENGKLISFMSISPILPSIRTQKESIISIETVFKTIKEEIFREEEKYGYKKDFFLPFFEDFEKARKGDLEFLSFQNIKGTFTEKIARNAITMDSNSWYTVTLFIPSNYNKFSTNSFGEGIFKFNTRNLLKGIFEKLTSEVKQSLILSAILIIIFLFLYFRSIKFCLVAITPLIFSLQVTTGLFAILWGKLNAMGLLAFCIVIGLGIDYGIFMVDAVRSEVEKSRAAFSIFLSALTTASAFGGLVFCRSPVLSNIGKVVLIGILLNLLSSFLLVPSVIGIISAGRKK